MSSPAAMALDAPLGPFLGRALATVRTDAAPEVEPARPRVVTWVEPAEPVWRLTLKNVGLTLATFGIWHFWGRAEARRQLVRAIHIDGRPLDYTGKGHEGFISFVIAASMTACVIYVTLGLFKQGGGGAAGAFISDFRWQRLTISLPLLFLLGSAAYRRRHHVLRRIWLEGDNFRLTGHPYSFAWQHFWSAFLVGITLGWAAPWRASKLEARKIAETGYRGHLLRADPRLAPLYKAFAVLWFGAGVTYFAVLVLLGLSIGPQLMTALQGLTLAPLMDIAVLRTGLTILGLGLVPILLSVLIYRAAWLEHRISAIVMGEARFHLRLPRLGFLWLSITNLLLLVATLGLAGPVAEARMVRYIIAHLHVEGRFDLPPRPLGT